MAYEFSKTNSLTVGGHLRTIIFEALGAASVCWETPEGAGEFKSEQCAEIGDALYEEVMKFVRGETNGT